MSVSNCEICGRPTKPSRINRVCDLGMCERCFRGDLSRRLEASGWRTSVRSWEVEAQSSVIHYVELTSALDRELPIRASFRPERLPQKAIKLFKREIQVGVPEFDDAVYISTDTPALTAKLLGSTGAKGAIMALVGTNGLLRIADNALTYSAQSKTKIEAGSVHLSCCVLLHCLEELLGDQG